MSMLAAKGVTNLTNLHINCSMGFFYSRRSWRTPTGIQWKETSPAKKIARKVYRDCYLWLEAMGSCYGDLYKGLEVLRLNGNMFVGREETWENVKDEDKVMYQEELRRLLRQSSW